MGSLLAAAAAIAVAVSLETSGLARFWEWTLSDWRARVMAKPSAATEQVKLVLVDQASLDWASAEMGLSWPWPREVYGVVVDYLTRCGAKGVALDILFTEPSSYGPDDDDALAGAFARNGHAAAAVFSGTQASQTSSWPESAAHANPIELDGTPPEALSSRAAAFPVLRSETDRRQVFRISHPGRVFRILVDLVSVQNAGLIPHVGNRNARIAGIRIAPVLLLFLVCHGRLSFRMKELSPCGDRFSMPAQAPFMRVSGNTAGSGEAVLPPVPG